MELVNKLYPSILLYKQYIIYRIYGVHLKSCGGKYDVIIYYKTNIFNIYRMELVNKLHHPYYYINNIFYIEYMVSI